MINNYKYKVVIAGAGPGDPELITYKAIIALRNADVVLTDRLVSPLILSRFVSSSAKIIYVGKQANNSSSVTQEHINNLMVRYANERKRVVRLKGGDVGIFSNLLDELRALKQNDIGYEIIPGITAAAGASAYSGIPLTARSFSSSVRFLSYHQQGIFKESYWRELAMTDDTLVFYMSGNNLGEIIEKLIEYRVDPRKLLAVIQQATTPVQSVVVSSLEKYVVDAKYIDPVIPTIVIIGKVVALYKEFGWIEDAKNISEYFTGIGAKKKRGSELLIA